MRDQIDKMRTKARAAVASASLLSLLVGLGPPSPILERPSLAELSEGERFGFAGVAALFQIGVGARPLSMGGAFVALADDENAAFYNPAGLAFLEARGLTTPYSRQFDLIDYAAVGEASRFLDFRVLQLYPGSIEVTSEFGNPNGERSPYLSQAGFGSLGAALGKLKLALGKLKLALGKLKLALGTRLKFYRELAGGMSGVSWALGSAVMLLGRGARLGLGLGALLENVLWGRIKIRKRPCRELALKVRLGEAPGRIGPMVPTHTLPDTSRLSVTLRS